MTLICGRENELPFFFFWQIARKWDAAGNQFSKSIIKLCAPLHCEAFDKVVLSLRKKYVSRGLSATKLSHFLWKLRRILAVKKSDVKVMERTF